MISRGAWIFTPARAAAQAPPSLPAASSGGAVHDNGEVAGPEALDALHQVSGQASVPAGAQGAWLFIVLFEPCLEELSPFAPTSQWSPSNSP